MPEIAPELPPSDLPSLLRWWAERSLGSPLVKVQLSIEAENGFKLSVGERPVEDALIEEIHRDIVDALRELDPGEKLTGPELAKRAGYEFDSRFRAACAMLVKIGRIQRSSKGYSVVS